MPNPSPFALPQIDHVGLRVRDLAAMQELYCDVRGCSRRIDGPPDAPSTPAFAELVATLVAT